MRTQGKVCHFALLLLPFTPLGTNARGLDSVMHKLLHAEGYSATATYAVTLPQADDDIVYTHTTPTTVSIFISDRLGCDDSVRPAARIHIILRRTFLQFPQQKTSGAS